MVFNKLNRTIMKKSILSNWNFIRFLRFVLGIAIIIQSALTGNWTMGFIGVLFTAMPVFNIGCCGPAGCAVPDKKYSETKKQISYEEVV
jgi:hypothetical protein